MGMRNKWVTSHVVGELIFYHYNTEMAISACSLTLLLVCGLQFASAHVIRKYKSVSEFTFMNLKRMYFGN